MKRFKEILEFAEAIVTILGFFIAIWGSLHLIESDILRKAKELVEYHHSRLK